MRLKPLILFAALIGAVLVGCQPAGNVALTVAQTRQKPLLTQGYQCVLYDGASFLAAGTGGRLDRIDTQGQAHSIPVPTQEDLLQVLAHEGKILVGGTGGTLLYSTGKDSFTSADTGIASTIWGIAYFQGSYYACTDNGVILRSPDGTDWAAVQTGLNKNIVSIAATDRYIMAITSESDILSSTDGVNWKIEDFNEVYKGYYEPFVFTNIKAIGQLFCVTGYLSADPGVPHMMMSDTGEVWIFRSLEQIEGVDPEQPRSIKINAIDFETDQILAACNDGQILTISDCSKCNKVESFGEFDLKGLALGAGKLVIVGEDYSYQVLDAGAARQYQIKPEQAYEDMLSGMGVIIDVRTQEEYSEGHVLGCIHIPLDEIKAKLQTEVPSRDTKLIFYCAGGVRSQKALEIALELGYQRVYNLGKFSDWPYAVE
ncbi:rhodanese-like domain-containing protein [Oscillospiraceae bacterium MB08-C2-2]|nr:rhodanese-like domain-containing protein [Oscillospiraceae bacterium MB08-C2-2]